MSSDIQSDTFRFIQITDLHLFAGDGPPIDWCDECEGINTMETLTAVLSEIHQRESDYEALVVTGDIAQDTVASTYERFDKVIAAEGVQTFSLPGNHDDVDLMTEVFESANLQVCGHYLTDYWLLVFLDSAVSGWSGGRLDAEELARLRVLLGRYPKHHALLCLHHHPVVSGSRWLDEIGLENSSELFDLVSEYPQVKGVLFGHVHQQMDSTVQHIKVMATPSTCIQFKSGQIDFAVDALAPAYRRIDLLKSGEIQTEVRFVDVSAIEKSIKK